MMQFVDYDRVTTVLLVFGKQLTDSTALFHSLSNSFALLHFKRPYFDLLKTADHIEFRLTKNKNKQYDWVLVIREDKRSPLRMLGGVKPIRDLDQLTNTARKKLCSTML